MKNCVLLNASGATELAIDVAEFKKVSSGLYSVNLGYTDCFGDTVDAFGDKTSLALLVTRNTQCTGTYEAICDAMYDNGRTSGTMVISANDGAGAKTVTFNANGWTVD